MVTHGNGIKTKRNVIIALKSLLKRQARNLYVSCATQGSVRGRLLWRWNVSSIKLHRNPFLLNPYLSATPGVTFTRAYSSTSLPWSEIMLFRSICVNLTEAISQGWTLEGMEEEFPALLEY